MLELEQLRQLLTVQEQGTISKAAEALHLSQPALSRSMQRLEESLGMPLFERHKNRVELNACGLLAARHAERILNEVEQATTQLQSFYRSQQTLVLGSCAPMPRSKMAVRLAACYPEQALTTEMRDPEELEQGLLEGHYHLVILDHPIDQEGVISFPYCEEHLSVVLPKEHPLAEMRDGIYMRELDGIHMLLYAQIGFWHRLCQREMPNAYFLVQTERMDFDELTQASTLPFFTTDWSEGLTVETDRVQIPILDKDANPLFWCSLLEKHKKRLRLFLHSFEKELI